MKPSDFDLSPVRFPSFFAGQEKIIFSILASSARFILLKAPTGSGKTVINWCAAKLLSDRFMYLVSTRELQSQLLRDTQSSGMFDLRGHSNYSCAGRNSDDEFTCSDRGECQYRDAVRESLLFSSIETNYSHWFVPALEDPQRFGDFDCLICDEMHLINDRLCQTVGFSISPAVLKALNVDYTFDATITKSWKIADFRDAAHTINELVSREIRTRDIDNPERQTPRYAKLTKLSQSLRRFIRDSETTEWAVDIEPKNTLTFSPVWSANYAERYLYRGIKKVILSSATAKESDLKRIGISSSDAEVFEMPSTFDPKRGPIVFVSKAPWVQVDNKIDEPRKRMIVNRIDQLLEFHFARSDKGIIQCTSYEWMLYLRKHSKLANKIIAHQRGESREAVLRYRKAKMAVALASPSIKEGVDFANELCRFIIVPKVPFLNLHAKPNLSQARVKSDSKYMLDETGRTFEQLIGRGRRNTKDYCVIYVMDAHVIWFVEQADLSKHVKAAFRKSLTPMELNFAEK